MRQGIHQMPLSRLIFPPCPENRSDDLSQTQQKELIIEDHMAVNPYNHPILRSKPIHNVKEHSSQKPLKSK